MKLFTNKDKNKIMFFLILDWLGFFFFFLLSLKLEHSKYIKMQLSTNKDKNKNKIMFFLILGWLGFFFFFFGLLLKLAFTAVLLKILAFSTSKSNFIYFIISLYNTPNIKCFIFFLSLHLK